jgi:hypothetical protein
LTITVTDADGELNGTFDQGYCICSPTGNDGEYTLTLKRKEQTPAEETDDTEEPIAEEPEAVEAPAEAFEEVPEEASTGKAEVTWKSGDNTLSATILVPLTQTDQTKEASGVLTQCPSVYCKDIPIPITAGDQDMVLRVNNGDFPAMTRYTIGDETTVLYDGGPIEIPANTSAVLDLSQTDFSGDLTLNGWTLTETEDPTGPQSDTAYVLLDGELLLPTLYQWGNATAAMSFQRQVQNQDTGQWDWADVEETFTAEQAGENIRVTAQAAEPGTYRILLDYKENDVEIYQAEIPFFVQNSGLIAGGTDNET